MAVAAAESPPTLLRRGSELLPLDVFPETHCKDFDSIRFEDLRVVQTR